MKYTFFIVFLLLGASLLAQTADTSRQKEELVLVPQLNTEADSLSYLMGLSLGYDIQGLPFDVDLGLFISGITGAYYHTAELDAEATRTIFTALQRELQRKQTVEMMKEITANQEKAEAFLRENMKRPEVILTSSGLQYEVLVKGDGPMPTDSSTVTVNYEGQLMDGTVFDSSYERGEPATFPLNRVIRGWTEGLQLMPVGSTYKFYIHPNLAYGARDQGPIPANSVLIFKVELLGIE
jgi:FKBP-type peptidyl-prolyl cis-trans isomerase FkpA